MDNKNKNENKLVSIFKKLTDSEQALKRIPTYFFCICVLLIAIAIQLGNTNKYLRIISENGTNIVEYETFDDTFVEIITEEQKDIEDYVPLLEEVSTETTTKKQNISSKVTTTAKNNSDNETTTNNKVETTTTTTTSTVTHTTTSQNISNSQTYVLNINSKKIHLPDCSFVARTKEENKKTVKLTDDELQAYVNDGYTICKTCGGD